MCLAVLFRNYPRALYAEPGGAEGRSNGTVLLGGIAILGGNARLKALGDGGMLIANGSDNVLVSCSDFTECPLFGKFMEMF